MPPRPEKTARLLLAGTLLLAAALRLWWFKAVDTQPVTDFDWYYERAKNLATGFGYTVNGHHTAYWPPGYPFFLAAFFKIFGPGVLLAKALNLALSILVVLQTYLLGRRLHPHPGLGLLAALTVAILPSMVAYSTILASEPLYTVLTLTATLTALRPPSEKLVPTLKTWTLVGLFIGAATLVRPQAALLPLVLVPAAALFYYRRQQPAESPKPRPLLALGICLAALALTQIPWLARNDRIFQTPVFVSTNGGDNLWIGHNPESTGRYQTPLGRPAPPAQELANDKAQRQAALAYLKEKPSRFFKNAPQKLSATFVDSNDAAYWGFQTQKGRLIVPGAKEDKPLYLWFRKTANESKQWFVGLAFGGFLMALALLPGRRALLLPTLMVIYTAFLAVAFFGNPRFGYPAVPFLALFIGTLAPLALPQKTQSTPSNDQTTKNDNSTTIE